MTDFNYRAAAKYQDIVILGMGASTANWNMHMYINPNWRAEITRAVWGINHAAYCYDVDLQINMHRLSMFDDREYAENKAALERYAKPVVMAKLDRDLSGHKGPRFEFPLDEVTSAFNCNYLANGVAYAIALAMMHKPKTINLFGCDFDYPDKDGRRQTAYERGRACVEYWIAKAENEGIEVTVAASSNLLDTVTRIQSGMYGYGNNQPKFVLNSEGKLEFAGFDPENKIISEVMESIEG